MLGVMNGEHARPPNSSVCRRCRGRDRRRSRIAAVRRADAGERPVQAVAEPVQRQRNDHEPQRAAVPACGRERGAGQAHRGQRQRRQVVRVDAARKPFGDEDEQPFFGGGQNAAVFAHMGHRHPLVYECANRGKSGSADLTGGLLPRPSDQPPAIHRRRAVLPNQGPAAPPTDESWPRPGPRAGPVVVDLVGRVLLDPACRLLSRGSAST